MRWIRRLLTYRDKKFNVEFEYDAIGCRILKTVSGIKTIYVNDLAAPIPQVLAQKTLEATEKSIKYTYGGDRISRSQIF